MYALKLIFLLTLISFGSQAQTSLTLEEAYRHLETANIKLEQARIQESLSREELINAKNELLPTANMSVSNNYNYGLSFDQVAGQLVSGNRWSNSANAGVSASLRLFDGFNSFHRIKGSVMQLERSHLQTRSLLRSLKLETAAIFYDILANKELHKASMEHLGLSETLLEQEQIQFEMGLKTKVDMALAASRVAGDETNKLVSANAYLSRLIDLKQLLHIPLSDSIELLIPDRVQLALQDSIDYAIESSLELLLAELSRAESELELKMAKSTYYPQVSLNGSYGTNYSSERTDLHTGTKMPFFDQLGQNKFLYIGASLSMPIFDAFKTRNNVRKANLNRLLRESDVEKVRSEEEKIWTLAWQEYRKSKAEYRSLEYAFESKEASYKAMKKRYDVGVSTYFELSTTLTEKNVAEFNLIKSRYTLLYAQEVIQLILSQ